MHVPATLVRGGTSKCWLFEATEVPSTLEELERLLVSAYGAADPVQLDGVGGATPTTSKAAVLRRGEADGIDVEYLFCQVGIGIERVEWGSNCGNCATAIGLWAVTRGLVPITGDRTRVVLRNTNTGAVLEAEVDTTGGIAHEFGTATVPGTRSGGVAVGLSFVDPVRSARSSLTDLVVDGGAVPVTLVDAGAPMALVDAARTGRDGAAPIAAVRRDIEWLRSVRRAAAPLMGLSPKADAVPKVGLVGSPVAYRSTTGERIGAADYDVSVRMLTMTEPHPAIGLTSAVGVAVANLLPGSVVHTRSTAPGGKVLRIGTPAGVVAVTCADLDGSVPRRVTVLRAARVLCEARISVAEPILS